MLLDSRVIFNSLEGLGPPELMGRAPGRGLSSQLTQKREGPLGTLSSFALVLKLQTRGKW